MSSDTPSPSDAVVDALGYSGAAYLRTSDEYISVYRALDARGTPVLVRFAPAHMATEGHYGIERVDTGDALAAIARRMQRLFERPVEGALAWERCGVEPTGRYLVMHRRFCPGAFGDILTPAPAAPPSARFTDGLRRIAAAVDAIGRRDPSFPVSLTPDNALRDDAGEIWLADAGVELVREHVHRTYAGPYTLDRKHVAERGFAPAASPADHVRAVGALWVRLRTGVPALNPSLRSAPREMRVRLTGVVEDALELLGAGERGVLAPLLANKAGTVSMSCPELIDALAAAASPS
jgi:hypothetical protein